MSVGRYAVFVWFQYYPLGGWNDFKEAHEDDEKARDRCADLVAEEGCYGHGQVVDLHTGKVVARFEYVDGDEDSDGQGGVHEVLVEEE